MRGDKRRRRQKSENYEGELHIRNEKVRGSTPLGSTSLLIISTAGKLHDFLENAGLMHLVKSLDVVG